MKTFLNYIASDIFHSISFRMFQVYCTWLFIQQLSNEARLTVLLIFIWLANVVTLPLAGIIADKIKSSYVLTFSCMLATCISCSILVYVRSQGQIINEKEIYFLFLIFGVLLSIFFSLINPISISIISKLFQTTESVAKAYKIKSSVWIIDILLGPTFSGILIATVGAKVILFFCSIFYCLSFLFSLLFFFQFKKYHSTKNVSLSLLKDKKFFFRGLIETFRISFSIKEEKMIALSSALANLVFVPFVFLLLPIMVVNVHRMGMLEVGLIELAMGIGILFSNVFFIKWIQNLSGKHRTAFLGVFSIALSLFIFAITRNFFTMIFSGFLMGIGLNTFNVTVNTRRVSCIPDGYRSRLEGLLIFACTISVPVGLLIFKFYIDRFFLNDIIFVCSFFIFLSSIFILKSRSLEEMLLTESFPYYQLKYPRLFVNKEQILP